ncbi:MAG: endonuclease III domain-containing protein, partial [bacterium]
MDNSKLKKIIKELRKEYPNPETELVHNSAFELLVATILSAQSTDKQVNKVTASLFKKYNKTEDFAKLDEEKLQKEINS